MYILCKHMTISLHHKLEEKQKNTPAIEFLKYKFTSKLTRFTTCEEKSRGYNNKLAHDW